MHFSPEYALEVIFHKKRNYPFEGTLASRIQQTLKNISITEKQFKLACTVAEEVLRKALKLNINLYKLFNARTLLVNCWR